MKSQDSSHPVPSKKMPKYSDLAVTTIEINSGQATQQRKCQQTTIEAMPPIKYKMNLPGNVNKFVIESLISVEIIQTVENNNTRNCEYLLFHLPFIHMLCDTIQNYKGKGQFSLLDILKEEIKRVNVLKERMPLQIPKEETLKVIMDALQLPKQPKGYFLKELGRFLEKYRAKMSTFLPYYFYLFELVSQRQSYICEETTIEDVRQLKREKIAWIRAKFHNDQLQ